MNKFIVLDFLLFLILVAAVAFLISLLIFKSRKRKVVVKKHDRK